MGLPRNPVITGQPALVNPPPAMGSAPRGRTAWPIGSWRWVIANGYAAGGRSLCAHAAVKGFRSAHGLP